MSRLVPDAQAAQPAAPAAAGRRIHSRHVVLDGSVVHLAVRPTFGGRRGLLVDVSAGGVGLVLDGPVAVGTALAVQPAAPGVAGRPARVAHCRPYPAPAGAPWLSWRERTAVAACRILRLPEPRAAQAWFVGCEFARPLSDDELSEVLGR
jgi:hypothetical protein